MFISMNNRRLGFLLIALLPIVSVLAFAAIIETNVGKNYAIAQSSSQNQTASGNQGPHFVAFLTGQGLPEPLTANTNATGNVTFTILGDGNTISYTASGTDLKNIRNVVLDVTTGGRPTTLVLFHYAPTSGLIKEGTGTVQGNITSADLTGPLQGKPMLDLVRMILEGNVYFKVQTTSYPLGEIGGRVTPVS